MKINKIPRCLETIKTKIMIRWKYSSDFQILKKAIDLGERILQGKQIIWDESNNFSKIVIIFLAANFHKIQSIGVLCKEGLGRDAVILLRTMFESLVDFRYITSDKTKVNDYIEYGYYSQLRMGKILLNSKSIKVDKEKIIKRIKELTCDWDKVKHRFQKKNGDICSRWNCGNLRKLAEKVDLSENYDYLYGFLSNYTHLSSAIAGDYIWGRNKDSVVVGIGTSEILIKEILPTATAIFIDILKIVNEEYKMDFDSSIKNLSERIKSKLPSKQLGAENS